MFLELLRYADGARLQNLHLLHHSLMMVARLDHHVEEPTRQFNVRHWQARHTDDST